MPGLPDPEWFRRVVGWFPEGSGFGWLAQLAGKASWLAWLWGRLAGSVTLFCDMLCCRRLLASLLFVWLLFLFAFRCLALLGCLVVLALRCVVLSSARCKCCAVLASKPERCPKLCD